VDSEKLIILKTDIIYWIKCHRIVIWPVSRSLYYVFKFMITAYKLDSSVGNGNHLKRTKIRKYYRLNHDGE